MRNGSPLAAVASVVHQIQGGRANLLAVLEEGQATIVEMTVPPGYRPRSLAEMQAVHAGITDAVFAVLTAEASVASRKSYGGTAPDRVRELGRRG